MLDTTAVKKVKDTISFTLDLAQFANKTFIKTPEREVPCSNGLRWNIAYSAYAAVLNNRVAVYLNINMKVAATLTVSVREVSFKRKFNNGSSFEEQCGGIMVVDNLVSSFYAKKSLTITCNVTFDIPMTFSCLKPSVFLSCGHIPPDLKLFMKSGCLEVHRSFLSLMSPVFHAMLTLDTEESKSGKMQITDFDFDIVKASIDFCYGRELTDSSIETIVGILRFADKYDIIAIVDQLERFPLLNLSIDTFPVIFCYAYDCSKIALLFECCRFFENNMNNLKVTKGFLNLHPALVVLLLKSVHGFTLRSTFDVLDYAYKNGLDFVVDYLEKPLLESMTLVDFCPAVKYAWKCSRDNLKIACATFVNTHRNEVMTLKTFFNLSPEIVHGMLKLACELDVVTN